MQQTLVVDNLYKLRSQRDVLNAELAEYIEQELNAENPQVKCYIASENQMAIAFNDVIYCLMGGVTDSIVLSNTSHVPHVVFLQKQAGRSLTADDKIQKQQQQQQQQLQISSVLSSNATSNTSLPQLSMLSSKMKNVIMICTAEGELTVYEMTHLNDGDTADGGFKEVAYIRLGLVSGDLVSDLFSIGVDGYLAVSESQIFHLTVKYSADGKLYVTVHILQSKSLFRKMASWVSSGGRDADRNVVIDLAYNVHRSQTDLYLMYCDRIVHYVGIKSNFEKKSDFMLPSGFSSRKLVKIHVMHDRLILVHAFVEGASHQERARIGISVLDRSTGNVLQENVVVEYSVPIEQVSDMTVHISGQIVIILLDTSIITLCINTKSPELLKLQEQIHFKEGYELLQNGHLYVENGHFNFLALSVQLGLLQLNIDVPAINKYLLQLSASHSETSQVAFNSAKRQLQKAVFYSGVDSPIIAEFAIRDYDICAQAAVELSSDILQCDCIQLQSKDLHSSLIDRKLALESLCNIIEPFTRFSDQQKVQLFNEYCYVVNAIQLYHYHTTIIGQLATTQNDSVIKMVSTAFTSAIEAVCRSKQENVAGFAAIKQFFKKHSSDVKDFVKQVHSRCEEDQIGNQVGKLIEFNKIMLYSVASLNNVSEYSEAYSVYQSSQTPAWFVDVELQSILLDQFRLSAQSLQKLASQLNTSSIAPIDPVSLDYQDVDFNNQSLLAGVLKSQMIQYADFILIISESVVKFQLQESKMAKSINEECVTKLVDAEMIEQASRLCEKHELFDKLVSLIYEYHPNRVVQYEALLHLYGEVFAQYLIGWSLRKKKYSVIFDLSPKYYSFIKSFVKKAERSDLHWILSAKQEQWNAVSAEVAQVRSNLAFDQKVLCSIGKLSSLLTSGQGNESTKQLFDDQLEICEVREFYVNLLKDVFGQEDTVRHIVAAGVIKQSEFGKYYSSLLQKLFSDKVVSPAELEECLSLNQFQNVPFERFQLAADVLRRQSRLNSGDRNLTMLTTVLRRALLNVKGSELLTSDFWFVQCLASVRENFTLPSVQELTEVSDAQCLALCTDDKQLNSVIDLDKLKNELHEMQLIENQLIKKQLGVVYEECCSIASNAISDTMEQ
ncbi:hypothetical protein MIR68_009722 [Amoeboaphelidium protococcarum]|nr:hypothetical protein MIR68_009722 [Amoeboaphelidium protococcarum]